MTAAALPKARKYNPGFLSDDELVASFCVRTAEFDSMVEMLRECTGSSNSHQIVIGPRGSGKTSLLLRVAAEVRRDAALSSGFFPIVFAEESYEVATAGEFWLECLSRLADQAPGREVGPDLRRTFEDLRTIHDDRTLGERSLGSLLDFSDREGKRLVLIVENLNMMFGDMADSEAGWRLRKTLQTEPRIILLASATSRFDEIDRPDRALYDLFRTLTLRPLDTDECAVLWEKVSGQPRPHDTIRSMEILTGGSPRLLAIVARFGGELSFRDLMDDLLDLVDDHTEYFKSHIDSLPAQERRVYLALAELWRPAATKEIADRSRLETSKCSAHLARLIERGVVQVAGGSARRKQYYLTERLYNIYYLLRRNRRPDRLIEALIRFMASYYSPPELRDIGVGIAREAQEFEPEMQSLYETAFAQLLEQPAIAEYREELLATAPADFSDTAVAARALFDEAMLLWNQDRVEEALAAFDELVSRYEKSQTPALLEGVATALFNKGLALGRLDRHEEEIVAYDAIVGCYGENETLVAIALFNKGVTLYNLNRQREALAVFDEVILCYGESETPVVVEQVATALFNKGVVLGELNRHEEELVAYDEVVGRYGENGMLVIVEQVATALFNKGMALHGLNRLEEAIVSYDEIARRYEENETPIIVEQVATALFNKGIALDGLNRLEEAVVAYGEVVSRYEESEAPVVVEQVATALVSKGVVLSKLNRYEDAFVAFDEVLGRYGDHEMPVFLERVAAALYNKGVAFGELNRPEEALAAFDEVVGRYGDRKMPALLEIVAKTLYNKGVAFLQLNRPDDALAAFDKAACRFAKSEHPVVREQTAIALLEKSYLELQNRQYEAATETAGRVLGQRLTESPEKLWQGHLIRARATLASDGPSACEQDLEAMVAILLRLDSLSRESLSSLMEFSIDLGPARMRDLIQASPAADFLLPFTTALEQELGLDPKVAREIEEVAQDVRQILVKLREGRTDDRGASASRR